MPLIGVQSDSLPCPLSLPPPPTGTLIPETWKTVSQINQSGKDGGAGEARDRTHGMLQSLGPESQGHSPEGQSPEAGEHPHPPPGHTPFQREIGISTPPSTSRTRGSLGGQRGMAAGGLYMTLLDCVDVPSGKAHLLWPQSPRRGFPPLTAFKTWKGPSRLGPVDRDQPAD